MKFADRMASGGIIHTPNLIKLGSGVQTFLEVIHIQMPRQTREQESDFISVFLFLTLQIV
jgi:hypothetical protein